MRKAFLNYNRAPCDLWNDGRHETFLEYFVADLHLAADCADLAPARRSLGASAWISAVKNVALAALVAMTKKKTSIDAGAIFLEDTGLAFPQEPRRFVVGGLLNVSGPENRAGGWSPLGQWRPNVEMTDRF